jgi:acetyl esterase/lipase
MKTPISFFCVIFLTSFTLLLLHSCSKDDSPDEHEIIPIDLIYEASPIDLQGNDALFARNISYGPYEENVFDIFLVESEKPTPLIVYIHGGGFVSGSKGIVYLSARNEIRQTLQNGASYATIDYRVLEEMDKEGVIKPMNDSKRCLQFFRYHHKQLNIDPDKIALYGASAGAGTCLWLGFSDDMREPDAEDQVSQQSTRIPVIAAKAPQSTYDLAKWESLVFNSLGMTLEDMNDLPNGFEKEIGLLSFYGIDSLEQLDDPDIVEYRKSVDMLDLMSVEDPPFWVNSNVENTGIPVDNGELFHHTLHVKALLDRSLIVGLECQAYMPPLNIEDPADEDVITFLLDRM